jgi:stage II sporulation protein D
MRNKNNAPVIKIGILSEVEIKFTLNGIFRDGSGTVCMPSHWRAVMVNGSIQITNDSGFAKVVSGYMLKPDDDNSSFILHSVTIGVDFHWQREEDQVFKGALSLICEEGKITAINILSIEEYLISVISSEMSATSSEELLKAHAVVSRSWLLAQIDKSNRLRHESDNYVTEFLTVDERVKWYDREDHKNYDVCADDHCQRYQGISRASTPIVVSVINETFGEVLDYNGTICDARYYKSCGGVTELFENAWEPVSHPYLQSVIDNPEPPAGFDTDLENEKSAVAWAEGNPDAFCNTNDATILSQVLNDYDQETLDFYRWTVSYGQEELSQLVKSRSGIDFGTVTEMIPLTRGKSGRITRLKIIGTKKTFIIGKELEIRKALSKTTLYSSCFTVTKEMKSGKTYFNLHGAGWGHGVGLCQIGAAVMGARGYSYKEILMHYFRGATLKKRY